MTPKKFLKDQGFKRIRQRQAIAEASVYMSPHRAIRLIGNAMRTSESSSRVDAGERVMVWMVADEQWWISPMDWHHQHELVL